MGEHKQSEGRRKNAASPVEDWVSSGVLDGKKKKAKDGQDAYAKEGEEASEDLTGPGGDPAEGKRDGDGTSWPA